MHYRLGHCPQCGTKIQVSDTDGSLNSFKQNYRQAYLKFANGVLVKTIICDKCLDSPDLGGLLDSITHGESEAAMDGDRRQLDKLLSFGRPVSIEIAKKSKQGPQGLGVKKDGNPTFSPFKRNNSGRQRGDGSI